MEGEDEEGDASSETTALARSPRFEALLKTLDIPVEDLVGESLPVIKKVALQRLESALANVSTIVSNEVRIANAMDVHLAGLLVDATEARAANQPQKIDRLMRRIVAVAKARGAHYDRIVATSDRVIDICDSLGIDTGSKDFMRPAKDASVKDEGDKKEDERQEKTPNGFRAKRSPG